MICMLALGYSEYVYYVCVRMQKTKALAATPKTFRAACRVTARRDGRPALPLGLLFGCKKGFIELHSVTPGSDNVKYIEGASDTGGDRCPETLEKVERHVQKKLQAVRCPEKRQSRSRGVMHLQRVYGYRKRNKHTGPQSPEGIL